MDDDKQNQEGEEQRNPIPLVELVLMLMLAASNDLVDYPVLLLQTGAMAIPAAGQALAVFLEFAGDVWDIGTGFFLCLWLYMKGTKVRWKFAPGVATGVEVIPGGDIVPSYSLAILLVYILSSTRAQQILRTALRVLPAGRVAQAAQRLASVLPKT